MSYRMCECGHVVNNLCYKGDTCPKCDGEFIIIGDEDVDFLYTNQQLQLYKDSTKALLEQNTKLRAALEFYADINNWDIVCMRSDGEDSGAPIFCEDHTIARKTLEELSK